MQVAHTGQQCSSTQPAKFAKLFKANRRNARVNQCLELAVIQSAGEDGVDDLYHNRHDVNEVGRLGAQSLLVNDAVHLVSGGLTGTHQQQSGALLLPNHHWGTVGRHADKTGGIQGVLLHTLKHLWAHVHYKRSTSSRVVLPAYQNEHEDNMIPGFSVDIFD